MDIALPRPRAERSGWTAALTDLARRVRHAPDRWLHRRRRAATLARLRAEPLPTSILFVCEGNIFRSPFAAGALAALLPPEAAERVSVASAGFLGPNRPTPPPALRAAAVRGVDLAAHRSALLTHRAVYAARLIVVMEPRQAWRLRARFGVEGARVLVMGDLDPLPIRTRAVRDPWEQDGEVLASAYARVGRCAAAMAAALAPTE